MKKDTHPDYFQNAKVVCACGHTFNVGSTMKEIRVEVCSACHPFYTGKQKMVDTARRIEKFQERTEKKSSVSAVRKGKTAKKVARKAKKQAEA